MYVPLSVDVSRWLRHLLPFRNATLGLPNYPVETLAVVTPSNDNRECACPIRALVLAQLTRRQLGLPDGIIRKSP